jgi:hypothetical protein
MNAPMRTPTADVSVKHCVVCGLRPVLKTRSTAKRPRQSSYCKECHAAKQREWRKTHPLTPEQRRKDAARSYANVYKRRGVLVPEPCKICGSAKSEMHHPDYSKPLEVVWLCRDHHLDVHKNDPRPAYNRKRHKFPPPPSAAIYFKRVAA